MSTAYTSYNDIDKFEVEYDELLKFFAVVYQESRVDVATDGTVTTTLGPIQTLTLEGFHLQLLSENHYLLVEQNLPVTKVRSESSGWASVLAV